MAKMIDVARHAGVSLKTVSRVLNNEPHVQDSLRQKVRESVRDLGYVPSATARSLRSNRAYCINLITHSLRSNFVNAIQFGALQACQQHGYRMQISMLAPEIVEDRGKLDQWCLELTKGGKPDGLILMPPWSSHALINDVISSHGIPVIRIGPNKIRDDNTTVTINDCAAAFEATTHLVQLGHKRIGFVRGKEDQDATHERFKGYKKALSEAGLPFDEDLVRPGLFDFETGLLAGDQLLALAEPPTAIFAANDDMAAGILVAAHRLGIAVPEQISIIGFDDSEIAEKMWPALTTVRQPLQELGGRAVEILVLAAGKKDNSGTPENDCLPYEMVLRQSTGPAPNQ